MAATGLAQAVRLHRRLCQLMAEAEAEGWEEAEHFWDLIPSLHQQPLPHMHLIRHGEHQQSPALLARIALYSLFLGSSLFSPVLFQAKSQLCLDVQKT